MFSNNFTMEKNFKKLAKQYKNELFKNVIPFWMKHSVDKECEGYFTCLLATAQTALRCCRP
jgi:mannose/cellobiose epimerase-like protein (N-acyl-D-glucosamine 2-epimerase family)